MRYIRVCAVIALILAILSAVPVITGLPLLALAVIILCVGLLVP